ncbi:hypothetical protein OY11_23455 [Salmonella enterica]|nr:hypothetical protein [Salmonella enterica]
MRNEVCLFYLFFVFFPLAGMAESMTWKNECVGYYNFQLPDKVETGIYPLTQIITKNILGINSIFGKYYEYGYQGKNVEGKYSNFYYNNYRIMVSEKKALTLINIKRKLVLYFLNTLTHMM